MMFAFALRDNMSSNHQSTTNNRRNRYTRSSTTSVTQLLSDSCSNLLQRLTTRVRGPSSTSERPIRSPVSSSNREITASRNWIRDNYSSILDRYTKKHDDNGNGDDSCTNSNYKRRYKRHLAPYSRELSPFTNEEKTLEPSASRTIVKSATTSFLLSEKAYPYVTPLSKREKTPGYHRRDKESLVVNPEVYKRYGRHKSGIEAKSRKIRPLNRNGKSEQIESNRLKNPSPPRLVDINPDNDPDKTPTQKLTTLDPININAATTTTTNTSSSMSEREAKRKEIQTLIMKYSGVDDVYGKNDANKVDKKPTAAEIIANKYQKNQAKNTANKPEMKAIESSAIVSCRST